MLVKELLDTLELIYSLDEDAKVYIDDSRDGYESYVDCEVYTKMDKLNNTIKVIMRY